MEMDAVAGGEETSDSRKQFDAILEKHIQRLIGTIDGNAELPLNLVTISCLILFSEQAINELEEFSTPADRYTEGSILSELIEIGFDATSDLATTIQEMIGAGYLGVDEQGGLVANESVLTMTQLLDRVFPKMPGMNLVAYLLQTVDEVESGRKHSEAALRQFDETLELHGVSVTDEEADAGKQEPPSQPDPQQVVAKDRPVFSERKIKKPDGPVSSRIVSPGDSSSKAEIKEVRFGDLPPEQSPADGVADEGEPLSESGESEAVADRGNEDAENSRPLDVGETPEVSEPSEALTDDEAGTDIADVEAEGGAPLSGPITESPHHDAVASEDGLSEPVVDETPPAEVVLDQTAGSDPETTDDDDIERRIAELESDLAMQCPLCKVSQIRAQETAAGKAYFKCLDNRCSFVSWGKPHHLVCPDCQNPFLVEDLKPNGALILKCPRATCRYWQRAAGEGEEAAGSKDAISSGDTADEPPKKKKRRRVVRKRVVRRKR
ncbi:MAG: hypothetical protein V3S89_10915 [Desulfobacterales bacterium]